ncbi:hypothetical protein [Mycolicibacterium sp.]|uniref:DUF7423 domain-containing protein n=1 Tax=Mycolicibacterium sp. TaxID=2320850 RepID=UPI00355F0EE2
MSGQEGRLSGLPDAALGLALGMSVARPDSRFAGRVSALADELKRRGVWEALLGSLDSELAAQIRLLDSVDRGRLWDRTGRR